MQTFTILHQLTQDLQIAIRNIDVDSYDKCQPSHQQMRVALMEPFTIQHYHFGLVW